ncbi:MAG: HNH endonuclease [Candidatus Paceibacterota bacterium]|jgi:hypothetical protein
MKLEIELVPQTSFFNNVRAIVTKEEWDVIRKECYKKAGYKCEICGGVGEKWPVECHEIWKYDDKTHIQLLSGMIALCPACHEVKHFGYAGVKGNSERALLHFMKINELDKFEAARIIDKSFRLWESRSQYQWTVDMTYLVNKVS